MQHSTFRANIDYFLSNKDQLTKDYPHMVVVIADRKVVSSHSDSHKAYLEAIKEHAPGDFIVQPTDYDTNEISHYHSNVIV